MKLIYGPPWLLIGLADAKVHVDVTEEILS
jgi:hypothetical protein